MEHLAPSVIGKNPFRIEDIWQHMYVDEFYSPGREKIHALGGIDMALWDIKAKAFKAPLHQLLGGQLRDFVECYATSGLPRELAGGRGGRGAQMSLAQRAAATMEAGYKVFRVDTAIGGRIDDNVFDTRKRVMLVADACKEIREGVGRYGNWMIDFHQRFDFADALLCCKMIEEYRPFLVEDPVREEMFEQDVPKLRMMTTCPLAPGEEWGQRWTFNKLVENHDVDYIRATLPNVGGVSEMLKIMGMCETHTVGIVPHFTGPIATAALVNVMSTFPGVTLMEYNYGTQGIDYLPEFLDFKDGKLYPNLRHGIGVTVDTAKLKPLSEFDQAGGWGRRTYRRPDGSPTHW